MLSLIKIGTKVRKFKGTTPREAIKKNLGFLNRKGAYKISTKENTVIVGGEGSGKTKILREILFAEKIKRNEKVLYLDFKDSLSTIENLQEISKKYGASFSSIEINNDTDLSVLLNTLETSQVLFLYGDFFQMHSYSKKLKETLETIFSYTNYLENFFVDDCDSFTKKVRDSIINYMAYCRAFNITMITTTSKEAEVEPIIVNSKNIIYLGGHFENALRLKKQTGEALIYDETTKDKEGIKVVLHQVA